MLQIHFAEVPEVVFANEVAGGLAHSSYVQLTMLGDIVCVLPVCCTESTKELRC